MKIGVPGDVTRDVQAIVYPIRKELRMGSDHNGRTLVRHSLEGDAYLRQGLKATWNDRAEAPGVLTAFVQIWCFDDTPGGEGEFLGSTHSESEPTMTITRVDELPPIDSAPVALISIEIPPERFRQLSCEVTEKSTLALSFTVIGTDYAHPILLDSGSAQLNLVCVQMKLSDHPGRYAVARQEALTSEFQQSLSSEVMPDSPGMLRTIAKEFASAAAGQSLERNERDSLAGDARHLLREIRTTFKEPLELNGDGPSNAWSQRSALFLEAIASLDAETAKKHRANYNRVWEHHNLNRVIQGGEAKSGPSAHGYRNDVPALEELAQLMSEYSQLSSPTLEWALVNALVYAECMAFARAILGDAKGLAGLESVVPLPAQNTFGATLKEVRKGAIAWIGEAVKIGVTFAVAFILAGQEAQTAWIITTGVTGARWIRRACLWREFHPKSVRQRLLSKMANLHNLLGREDFDAGVVRHMLYQVTTEGAVFSPWVFRILDARIPRGVVE